jgi:hypothetical protein
MTRKIKLLIITGAILLIIAVSVFIITRRTKEDTIDLIDPSEVIPYLKDGDIMMRLGDGPWSPAFRNMSLTDKRFSHLGVVRIRNEKISIINSVGFLTNKKKGVEEVSLEKFLEVAKRIGVFRAKFMDGNLISDKALDYIDRPFDWGFDLNDDSKIYCTELLYTILKSYEQESNLKTVYDERINKEIVPPDSISNSATFDEIIYILQKNSEPLPVD